MITDLRDSELVAQALHEASHVMVHVVKDHVDAPLEVVAFVCCTPQQEDFVEMIAHTS